MHPTAEFITNCFERYNALIFESSLPPIRIVLRNAGSSVGKFTFPRNYPPGSEQARRICKLTFSVNFNLSQKEWEDTVIHEMIHYAIWQRGLRDTAAHGRIFRTMMQDINKHYGRGITIRHHSRPGAEVTDRRIRKHYICLSRWNDGRTLITVTSQSAQADISDRIKSDTRILSARWFVSNACYFNKFPHVRTPKFYLIPSEDLPLLREIFAPIGGLPT